MQNVRPTQLKTAIILTLDEYKEVVNTVAPHTYIHCETDGLWYERDEGFPEIEEDELRHMLAPHFGVAEITSIHIDDCDYVGVWLIYKEHAPTPTPTAHECGEFNCVRATLEEDAKNG